MLNMAPPIHDSSTRLYEAARELRGVTGQSAVGRLLGVTPQVMKNWETRGVSEAGALIAQRVVGCDANWLLTGIKGVRYPAWKPTEAHTLYDPSHEGSLRSQWPFSRISEHQYNRLTPDQKRHVEEGVLLLIHAREPPEKHDKPEPYSAAA